MRLLITFKKERFKFIPDQVQTYALYSYQYLVLLYIMTKMLARVLAISFFAIATAVAVPEEQADGPAMQPGPMQPGPMQPGPMQPGQPPVVVPMPVSVP